jgi:GNAT superfamily N-acetyltransferase
MTQSRKTDQFLLEFNPEIILNSSDIISLEHKVRESHKSPIFYRSVKGLCAAKTIKICGLVSDYEIISFAWYSLREWMLSGKVFLGASIGLVTTDSNFRGRGFAKKLIESLEDYLKQVGVSFLYLQGIEGFYLPLGFRGFAPKSQFLFSLKDLEGGQLFRTQPMTRDDIDEVATLSTRYKLFTGSSCVRSTDIWQDLAGPLAQTFLFNEPQVIKDPSNRIVGYFSSTPGNQSEVREFMTVGDTDIVFSALRTIARRFTRTSDTHLALFSPDLGPLAKLARKKVAADFIRYLRPYSSNMIKWLKHGHERLELNDNFIFQADNL